MKSLLLFALSAIICFPLVSCNHPDDDSENEDVKCELYQYSNKIVPSSWFSVDIEGRSATVLETIEHDICVFGAEGLVTVEVGAWREQISTAVVRPVSENIDCEIVDGKARFTLKPYDQVVVELNGNEKKCLFIFVNPIESGKPDQNDPDVLYFKAGTVTEENITATSGKTIYIEGGAIVKGSINAPQETSNVSIRGCGILDSRDKTARGVNIHKTNSLTIEGITLINNNNWSTLIAEGDGVDIKNYKVVAVRSNVTDSGKENDALDLLGCRNAVVSDCFAYAHDDLFCVKSHKWDYKGKVDNVLFQNCTAWNVYGGNSFVIGAEINEDVSNVTYRNCCSIRGAGEEASVGMYRGGISVHNCAGGHVSGILFENIWLEDCREYGICLDIRKSYVKNLGNGVEYTPGTCDGITLRNIHILKEPRFGNLVKGKDDEHRIENVLLEDVFQEGEKLQNSDIGSKIKVSFADCTIR